MPTLTPVINIRALVDLVDDLRGKLEDVASLSSGID